MPCRYRSSGGWWECPSRPKIIDEPAPRSRPQRKSDEKCRFLGSPRPGKKFLLTLLKYRINQLKFGTAPISDAGQDESSGRALGPSASAGADWIPSACRNLLDELKMADTAIFLPCGLEHPFHLQKRNISTMRFTALKLNSLRDQFIEELRDLYSAETQLVNALKWRRRRLHMS